MQGSASVRFSPMELLKAYPFRKAACGEGRRFFLCEPFFLFIKPAGKTRNAAESRLDLPAFFISLVQAPANAYFSVFSVSFGAASGTISEKYQKQTSILSVFTQGGDSVDAQSQIPNRLIDAASPYLLQHAYNPVQWYPWGEEAFEKARLEDKPVFLSIGYS